jgi:hypothetical protein
MKNQREIAFEFTQIGASVKVTAIDMRTGKEVSIAASAATPRPVLQRMALQKLEYVLRKDEI